MSGIPNLTSEPLEVRIRPRRLCHDDCGGHCVIIMMYDDLLSLDSRSFSHSPLSLLLSLNIAVSGYLDHI